MTSPETTVTDKARLTPDAFFSRPLDVVNYPHLTREQKIAALDRWALTLQDRLRATGEGMAPSAGKTADEAAAVEEIAKALKLVKDEQVATKP